MTPVELVCFHHAGGGSASFHRLRRALAALSADVVPTAVKLPGRESRRDEPRYVDADACVRALADELDGLLSRPHVLLGHSMGALLAYSLAQQRISRGLRAPEAVIVVSCHAPHLPGPLRDLHLVDDRELAVELAHQGGLPAEILSRPEWLALLLPTLRDDLRICQSYRPSGEPPLPCPLHIFGGHDDPLTPPDTLAAWSSYSVQPRPVRLFAGDHFLFRQPDPELLTAVARIVEDVAQERELIR
jgi:surfactin synthase thioesterase subunit